MSCTLASSTGCLQTRFSIRSADSTSHSSRKKKKNRKIKKDFQSAFHPSEKKKVFRHKVLGQLILCLFLFILYWKNYFSEIRGRRITVVTCEVLVHFAIQMQKSSFLSYESLKTKPKAPKPKQNKNKTKALCI